MKTLGKIVGALALLGALVFAYISWIYSNSLLRVETAEKAIALTYDDGPNPPHTQALLELLAQRKVKATFFLKGRNVEAFPELAAQVVAQGHEVANHSYHHYAMGALRKEEMLAELVRVNELILVTTGVQPSLFRPPFGIQGAGLKRALDELGMLSVLADASGTDWEVTDARQVADLVLADVGPGSIVLLHDGHGDVDGPDEQDSRAHSVAATALIIDELRAKGYRFVTVSELVGLAEG
ncbi:MAG: polysaccharide deacetylase family protein [Halioglobus sp.]|nr:polysaccharide deacetylase family protein [Halioglobus sp.]